MIKLIYFLNEPHLVLTSAEDLIDFKSSGSLRGHIEFHKISQIISLLVSKIPLIGVWRIRNDFMAF